MNWIQNLSADFYKNLHSSCDSVYNSLAMWELKCRCGIILFPHTHTYTYKSWYNNFHRACIHIVKIIFYYILTVFFSSVFEFSIPFLNFIVKTLIPSIFWRNAPFKKLNLTLYIFFILYIKSVFKFTDFSLAVKSSNFWLIRSSHVYSQMVCLNKTNLAKECLLKPLMV